MKEALDVVLSLIVGLLNLVLSAVAAIDGALRAGLTRIGVEGQPQNAVLLIVAVVLIIAAVQLFGRALAILIAVFLLLLVLQALVPNAMHIAPL